MSENRSRFVLVCQQTLVLGTVLAVAAPAATLMTLDIVGPRHEAAGAGGTRTTGSLVAAAPVAPEVTEVPVTGIDPRGLRVLTHGASQQRVGLGLVSADTTPAGQELAAVTAPEPASGYATVGVTWAPGQDWSEDQITLSVRSRTVDGWSHWEQIKYDPQEGPDPDSAEGRNARPGTDPILVGDVDAVQVKAETTTGEVPRGMEMAVIDPGATTAAKVESPAIDTAKLASADTTLTDPGTTDPGTTDPGTTDPGPVEPVSDGTGATLSGAAADVTPKPMIYSRAQWGADESMRDKSSLHYYEVHAGFVHHTVNANNYTRAQVPALIRGIYAYHTQSKGWSDIGYNFIVDRFGRIWEGRYGGVDRPVVGAHTLNYNEYSFAMSALGNFETGHPSSAMVDAYARLFAWKLSLHGVNVSSTRQWVGSRYFQAINGHRDAGQTACPGKYLYAKIPTIRRLAAGYQHSFATRAKQANISGTSWPDLVVRDKSTQKAFVVRTAGQLGFAAPRTAARGWTGLDVITPVRDVTGDGVADMLGRTRSTKVTRIYPGNRAGGFGAPVTATKRFAGADQMTGVADMTGDGKSDLVTRSGTTHKLYLFPGNGRGGFGRSRVLSTDWSAYNVTVGVGDLNGDRKNDLVVRDAGGRAWLVPGTGRGALGAPVALPGAWGGYDVISGIGDVDNDRRSDLLVRDAKTQLSYVLPGNGAGGFGAPVGPFTTFKRYTFVTLAGQVTGNQRWDVVGQNGAGDLVVFANNGRRNIGSVVDSGTSLKDTNLILNVGDWNGDGHGDLMTRSASTGDLLFRAGDGRSHFAAPVLAGKGWGAVGLVAAVGDVTGDGYPDLMGQPAKGAMRIYPGNGGTGFRYSYVAHSAVGANEQVGAGLWDGDGSPDSIFRTGDGSLMLYPGNGPGGLTGGRKVGAGGNVYDWMQGVGDADGDGRADLMAREKTTGRLWLLPGNGSGFAPRRLVGDGFAGFDLG